MTTNQLKLLRDEFEDELRRAKAWLMQRMIWDTSNRLTHFNWGKLVQEAKEYVFSLDRKFLIFARRNKFFPILEGVERKPDNLKREDLGKPKNFSRAKKMKKIKDKEVTDEVFDLEHKLSMLKYAQDDPFTGWTVQKARSEIEAKLKVIYRKREIDSRYGDDAEYKAEISGTEMVREDPPRERLSVQPKTDEQCSESISRVVEKQPTRRPPLAPMYDKFEAQPYVGRFLKHEKAFLAREMRLESRLTKIWHGVKEYTDLSEDEKELYHSVWWRSNPPTRYLHEVKGKLSGKYPKYFTK